MRPIPAIAAARPALQRSMCHKQVPCTAADGVNIYFENVGGAVSIAPALSVSYMPGCPPLQCRGWKLCSRPQMILSYA